MKSTLYLKTKVLPGNKIELENPNFIVGETVEVVILVSDNNSDYVEKPTLSLEQRLAFLKLPMTERRNILESQSQKIITHYQQDFEWKDLISGDIIDY